MSVNTFFQWFGKNSDEGFWKEGQGLTNVEMNTGRRRHLGLEMLRKGDWQPVKSLLCWPRKERHSIRDLQHEERDEKHESPKVQDWDYIGDVAGLPRQIV